MRATRETAAEQPDGTWIIGLRVDGDDARRIIDTTPLGHELQVALPDQAPRERSVSRAPVQHVGLPDDGIDATGIGPVSMDPEIVVLLQQAFAACKSARFHRWLIDVHSVSMDTGDGDEIARGFLLHYCGAKAPEQLAVGSSLRCMTDLLGDFRRWEASAFKKAA